MYIDNFHQDICESNIKHYRKTSRLQFGVFLFNVICFSIYVYFIISFDTKTAWGFGVGLGAFFISIFWSFLFMMETFGELRDEKEKLKYYKKLKEEHHFYQTLKNVEAMKAEYERMLKDLRKSKFGDRAVGGDCQIVVATEGVGGGNVGSATGCGHKGHS